MAKAPRADNAIDFWRGLALVMIFIDHVPGNDLARVTLRNFAISDAAELFVFLAGWSCSYATGGPATPASAGFVVSRLWRRAVEIYRVQIVITVIALAMLAATALWRSNPLFLEWHNAEIAYYDPTRTVIGLVLLSFQLSYFNILPLYVVLLLVAPLFVMVGRRSTAAMLALSVTLYLWAIATRTNLPSWPAQDAWYFNPLTWQLLFVGGFALADVQRSNPGLAASARRALPFAVALLAAGLAVRVAEFTPDPLGVPEPRYLFLFDKTYLSPVRLVSLAALVVAFHAAYPWLAPRLGRAGGFLCALGRNSLAVFAIGSLAALAAQIARFLGNPGFALDVLMILSGLLVMGFVAWFVEWGTHGPALQRQRRQRWRWSPWRTRPPPSRR